MNISRISTLIMLYNKETIFNNLVENYTFKKEETAVIKVAIMADMEIILIIVEVGVIKVIL
jgi:hypothetical protein